MVSRLRVMRVVVIGRNLETYNTLSLALKLSWPDCRLLTAADGAAGIELVASELPQLVLMELNLPDIDGYEVIQHIRATTSIPIIVLSDKVSETAAIRALELGADDYVVKPFSPLDILARAKAILRRIIPVDGENLPPFVAENVTIDFSSRRINRQGRELRLTPTEYRLLSFMACNADRLVTIDSLKEHVWGNAEYLDSGTIRKCICQLRRKLGDDSSNPRLILNQRGIGYRLCHQRSSKPQPELAMVA